MRYASSLKRVGLCSGWFAISIPALADNSADLDETVTNTTKRAPSIEVSDFTSEDQAAYEVRLQAYEGRRYPAVVYMGAEMLHVEPDFIHDCREGLELIYQRDYESALVFWEDMGRKWRGSGVSPVGRVLVWQALMLENFDFRYEQQYKTAWWQARKDLEESMMQPGNDAWEYFMLGAMLGVDSIHLMRKEEYVSSLSRGYEAMKAIKKSQELAPGFTDSTLGDGLFNYWATVVSLNTKSIPNRTDDRQKGIRQIKRVEQQGIFLRPAATLALTYTWIEEGNRKQALQAALRNQELYPDNVINNQVLGRVYMYNKKYGEAEKTFQHVLKVDPANRRVHYYLGLLYIKWGRADQALESLDHYLEFSGLTEREKGGALYYKGNVYFAREDYGKAKKFYKEAWRISGNKRAKNRLQTIERRQEKAKK